MVTMTFDLTPFRDEYPWEPKRFDRGDGIHMNYLDEGSGETVVLLHGNPTRSFYWRHLVRGLSDSYRCIVPDHVGMGLSDKPGDDRYDYTLSRRADDLELPGEGDRDLVMLAAAQLGPARFIDNLRMELE